MISRQSPCGPLYSEYTNAKSAISLFFIYLHSIDIRTQAQGCRDPSFTVRKKFRMAIKWLEMWLFDLILDYSVAITTIFLMTSEQMYCTVIGSHDTHRESFILNAFGCRTKFSSAQKRKLLIIPIYQKQTEEHQWPTGNLGLATWLECVRVSAISITLSFFGIVSVSLKKKRESVWCVGQSWGRDMDIKWLKPPLLLAAANIMGTLLPLGKQTMFLFFYFLRAFCIKQ